MEDTPEKIGKMVRATFKGTGTKKIMLIAHMDTVYPRGMLDKQPFRIEGDKAYGLGIADDKQGIAMIMHTVAMLKALNFKRVRHADGADQRRRGDQLARLAQLITRLGAEHDVTVVVRGLAVDSDKLSLATAASPRSRSTSTGTASHAGSAPETGVNALYELAHQILQMRDLSDPAAG